MKSTIEKLFKNKEFMAEFDRVTDCKVKNLSTFKNKIEYFEKNGIITLYKDTPIEELNEVVRLYDEEILIEIEEKISSIKPIFESYFDVRSQTFLDVLKEPVFPKKELYEMCETNINETFFSEYKKFTHRLDQCRKANAVSYATYINLSQKTGSKQRYSYLYPKSIISELCDENLKNIFKNYNKVCLSNIKQPSNSSSNTTKDFETVVEEIIKKLIKDGLLKTTVFRKDVDYENEVLEVIEKWQTDKEKQNHTTGFSVRPTIQLDTLIDEYIHEKKIGKAEFAVGLFTDFFQKIGRL